MLAEIDWTTLQVSGAFIVGAVLGGIVVLRVFKYVIEYLRDSRKGDSGHADGNADAERDDGP